MIPIPFRPHHFLCTLCFQGKGYSPDFIRQYKKIHATLSEPEGDGVALQVVNETDAICAPCPHKRGRVCATETKIKQLDTAHANALTLIEGETLTWGEAKIRIQNQLTLEIFHDICEPCSWKSYGLCETVLTAFLPTEK